MAATRRRRLNDPPTVDRSSSCRGELTAWPAKFVLQAVRNKKMAPRPVVRLQPIEQCAKVRVRNQSINVAHRQPRTVLPKSVSAFRGHFPDRFGGSHDLGFFERHA